MQKDKGNNKMRENREKREKREKTVQWIFRNAKKSVPAIIILAAVGAAMSYLSVRFAFVSRSVMDIAVGSADGSLAQAVALLFVLIALQMAAHIVYTLVEVRSLCTLSNNIQSSVFRTVLESDYLSLSAVHSGETVNMLSSDVSVITSGVLGTVPKIFTVISQLIFSLWALFTLDSHLALICVVAFPLVTVAARLYGRRMKMLHKQCRASDGKIKSYMQEMIQNVLAVKAFVREASCAARLGGMQAKNRRLNVRRGIISILSNLMFFFIMTVGYYLALAWCAYKISIGIMTVGTLTAVLQLVGQLQEPFGDFSSLIPGWYATLASAERLIALEDTTHDPAVRTVSGFEGMDAENVSFAYGGEEILHSASLSVNKGEIIGISGISGIGKSTFMQLVMGILHPESGEISVRCAEGRIVSDGSLRSLFAYVPQGNMILSGTVRDNIAFFAEDVPDEMIISSAKAACIFDYISSLPDGFDTMLGEGGAGLSEGQIQRLAVARALCTDRPVILLDEATSALDAETEKELIANIKKMSGKTCIFITHKTAALEICDRVISIKNGSII